MSWDKHAWIFIELRKERKDMLRSKNVSSKVLLWVELWMLSYDELFDHDIDVYIWECWEVNVLIETSELLSYNELFDHDIDVYIQECWVTQINVLIETFELY